MINHSVPHISSWEFIPISAWSIATEQSPHRGPAFRSYRENSIILLALHHPFKEAFLVANLRNLLECEFLLIVSHLGNEVIQKVKDASLLTVAACI